MNFIKRAVKSIVYRKTNAILMLLIYAVMSVLVLSGLTTNFGANQYAKEAKSEMRASVQVANSDRIQTTVRGDNTVPIALTDELAKSELVHNGEYDVSLKTLAIPNDFDVYMSDVQKTEYKDWANITVIGVDDTTKHEDFTSETQVLQMGRHLEKGDTNQCVVSLDLVQSNGLVVGDTIEVIGFLASEDGITYTKPISLEIVGYFTSSKMSAQSNSPDFNYENQIYTSVDTTMLIDDNDKVHKANYVLTDPTSGEEFEKQALATIKDLGYEGDYHFLVDNTDYLRVSLSTGTAVSISEALVVMSVVMATTILSLLVISNLNDRGFEIGILMSLGENRFKIALQMIVENVVIIIGAITLSLAFGGFITENVANVISSVDLEIMINEVVISLLYACGIGIALAVSLIAVYRIVMYKPREILSGGE